MWKSDKILCEKREIERDTKKVLTINVYFLFKAKKSKIVGQCSIKKICMSGAKQIDKLS